MWIPKQSTCSTNPKDQTYVGDLKFTLDFVGVPYNHKKKMVYRYWLFKAHDGRYIHVHRLQNKGTWVCLLW